MQRFYLYKRTKSNSWYVKFRDPVTGKVRNARSVDSLHFEIAQLTSTPISFKKLNKAAAIDVVYKAINLGLDSAASQKHNVIDYVRNFWDFDKSDYIKLRNRARAGSINKDYVNGMARIFENHIVPLLPPHLELKGITVKLLNDIQISLLDNSQLQNRTINYALSSLRVPYLEALRLELVKSNPFEHMIRLFPSSKERGIPSMQEMNMILQVMEDRAHIDLNQKKAFLAVLVAAYTGMRQGEILSLKNSSFMFSSSQAKNQVFINIDTSYAKLAGFKEPKGKRNRRTVIPRWLYENLIELYDSNRFNNGLIFSSTKSPDLPIDHKVLTKYFYRAMNEIGITEQERKERNINFHSLRHFFNTQMRGNINESLLREVVGHQSIEMTDRYTHETEEKLIEVGSVTSRIFDFDIAKKQRFKVECK